LLPAGRHRRVLSAGSLQPLLQRAFAPQDLRWNEEALPVGFKRLRRASGHSSAGWGEGCCQRQIYRRSLNERQRGVDNGALGTRRKNIAYLLFDPT
jgi:hypothetical protein